MKKFIFAVAMAMCIPGMVSAATIFGATTQNDTVTGGVAGDCTLLGETVELYVSTNAIGGWACDETDSVIQVAACHTGGSREQGVACVDTDPVTAGDQLPAGCSAIGGFSTIPSFKAYFYTSEGGVNVEEALGTRCSEASLGAVTSWVN